MEKNLKIEELEYRLEFSSEKIAAKLDKALANAREQQEAEQKRKEQRVISSPTDDDEQLSQSDDSEYEGESDSSLESLSSGFYSMSDTDSITAMLEAAEQNEPENSEDEDIDIISQSDENDQQEASEQQATTQHVIAQPTEDDEGILALSGDFVGQWLTSGHSWGRLPSMYYAMSETSPAPMTAVPEPEPTNAQTQQEEQEESPVQRVIEQSLDDIETPALSADPDPLEAIDSWQPVLPPVSCKMSETLPGVSIASSIGLRPTMEDAHIATHFTIKAGGEDVPISILGVFDGHGTKEVADHAAQHIVKFLTKWLELYNAESLTDEKIWNAIKIALVDLSRSSHCALGGSTACVALIIKNDLWIANLGDSRAILVNRNGEDIQLSEDAKPENEIYKTSIEKRGGFVGNALGIYRVNNNLAPARALADHHLGGAVCSRAKITQYPLTDFSGCLVLVCDGVTEVFTTKEIGDIARDALNENDPTVNIAERIAKESLRKGTTDNVSAVVAPLGDAD
ncbi:hypothetical protein GCM10023116_21430 [Kistimonas scapharcae]|uniref:PPM-type phosphatase domain-containing protein n=2 Tax=Kistimonas scapharcae TaxID=1036133 RepID=A0ABP8V4N2_9GAMM